MNSSNRPPSFGRELLLLALCLILTGLVSLWYKVHVDSSASFAKAEWLYERAVSSGSAAGLLKAGDLYVASLRSYAPLDRTHRPALSRVLAIGRALEAQGKADKARDLYRQARGALAQVSFFYTPHRDLDARLRAALNGPS